MATRQTYVWDVAIRERGTSREHPFTVLGDTLREAEKNAMAVWNDYSHGSKAGDIVSVKRYALVKWEI